MKLIIKTTEKEKDVLYKLLYILASMLVLCTWIILDFIICDLIQECSDIIKLIVFIPLLISGIVLMFSYSRIKILCNKLRYYMKNRNHNKELIMIFKAKMEARRHFGYDIHEKYIMARNAYIEGVKSTFKY